MMNEVRELLRDADPIQHEPPPSSERRDSQRRVVLAASTGGHREAPSLWRSKVSLVFTIAAVVIAGLLLAGRLWSPVVREVHAAVRFEVRLAEDQPGSGLPEVKLPGKDRSIYLHQDVVVTNSDISTARAIHVAGEYAVGIEFTSEGAKKMREATASHIGKPIAILLDGQVVMAPVLRGPIDGSVEVTDDFTEAEAEKIAKGIVGPP